LGEDEGKERDAEETHDVSRRKEENRRRAAGSLGEGKGSQVTAFVSRTNKKGPRRLRLKVSGLGPAAASDYVRYEI